MPAARRGALSENAARSRVGAAQRPQQLRPPGAREPADADDLAPSDHDREPAQQLVRQVLDFEQHLARTLVPRRIDAGERPPDHHPHQRVAVEIPGPAAACDLAIPHHDDALADREDLVELVRDVDEGDALGRERVDDAE